MLKKIEALRMQPKHVRNRYAFWIAFSITLLVLLIWLFTLPSRLSTKEVIPVQQAESTGSLSRFFGDATNRISETFTNMRTQVEYVKVQEPVPVKTNTLDLDALIASSTKNDMVGTSTQQVATSTPIATSSRP